MPCNGDSSHLGFSKLFYPVDPDSFQALASSQIFLAYLLNCAAIRYSFKNVHFVYLGRMTSVKLR